MARVSIGLPVRNGAATIRATLGSLLAQSFTDFELLISDNASTDGTEAICRAIVDPRVRYIRQPRDLGGPANYRFVLDHTDAEFFMWAAADDRYYPGFIADNVAALDRLPVVTSIGQVIMGTERRSRRIGNFPITGSRLARIRSLLAWPGDNSRLCGLFRRAVIASATVRSDFVAWDWATMLGVVAIGDLHVIDAPHIVRGTDGESRHPEYHGNLFLRPFTAWLWRALGPLRFMLCLDLILYQNLKFNRLWLTIRTATTRHRSHREGTPPLRSGSRSLAPDKPTA